jgi:hypothetical protein
MTLSILWGLLLPLVLIIALIDLATMGQERRIRVLKRCGHSQQVIADRLGITRYRVRLALAS